MRTPIALTGFMGSGKTTVGQALARHLSVPWFDLDAEIEAKGTSIEAWFERGEAEFRKAERRALARLPKTPHVVSLGGGSYSDARTRVELARSHRTVWLDVPLADAEARIPDGSSRPLWNERVQRFEKRLPEYRQADHHLNALTSVNELVQCIASEVQRLNLPIPTPWWSAPSFEGLSDRLAELTPSNITIVSDDQVWKALGEQVQTELGTVPTLLFPAGEAHKTLDTWRRLLDQAVELGLDRQSVIVAVGGGVTGDMAGFVAATLYRGIRIVQVPTSTLAWVDSSTGAKTAVNHSRGKNLVGAFHDPAFVFAPFSSLRTLPEAHRRAGVAEAMKMAATHDATSWSFFEHSDAADLANPTWWQSVVSHAVRTKAKVVDDDPFERGARRLLNAGHTAGHALETAAGHGALLHGDAVALGLLLETQFCVDRGWSSPSTLARMESLFERFGLPITHQKDIDVKRLQRALDLDKKMHRDTLELPCISSLGSSTVRPVKAKTFSAFLLDSLS